MIFIEQKTVGAQINGHSEFGKTFDNGKHIIPQEGLSTGDTNLMGAHFVQHIG